MPSPKFPSCKVAEECQELSFRSFVLLSITMLSPVILSLHHLLPHLFCPCYRLSLSHPLPCSGWPPHILFSPSLPSSEGSQVSTVTALARKIMVCNSLPAPLSWAEDPLVYMQRDVVSVCICVHEEGHKCVAYVCVCGSFSLIPFMWIQYMQLFHSHLE